MSAQSTPADEGTAAREHRAQQRLHELAAASGLRTPPVDTTEIPTHPDELDWMLASALAQHTSRTTRRRCRMAWGSAVLVAVVELASATSGALELLDDSPYGWPVTLALGVFTVSAPFTTAGLFRHWHRTRDAAALEILAAGGRDPVAIVRQVFRDRTRLSRWQHLIRVEPTDEERIAAAERHRSRPAPALH